MFHECSILWLPAGVGSPAGNKKIAGRALLIIRLLEETGC